eukprot:symbB.v1.2.018688.t1/scaffold1410.1/size216244/14
MGFVRPCVTLHCQASCDGDIDALTRLSQRCGAARTLADICGFTVPAVLYDVTGWAGVAAFGAALAFLYLVLALQLHLCPSAVPAVEDKEVPISKRIRWIDWVLSGAFVSTEMQWNVLNTAVPAVLISTYQLHTSAVGMAVGSGALVSMCYLLSLPALPRLINPPRPMNLLMSYSLMSCSWLVMLAAVLTGKPILFVLGIWMFLAMGNNTQVVLLECLTGISDAETSSQVVGCAVGTFGSYAGGTLFALSDTAPFVACAVWSLLGAVGLTWSISRRRLQRAKSAGYEGPVFPASQPSEIFSLPSCQGLNLILEDRERAHSFIGPEMEFRALSPANSECSTTLTSPDANLSVLNFEKAHPEFRVAMRCTQYLSGAQVKSRDVGAGGSDRQASNQVFLWLAKCQTSLEEAWLQPPGPAHRFAWIRAA